MPRRPDLPDGLADPIRSRPRQPGALRSSLHPRHGSRGGRPRPPGRRGPPSRPGATAAMALGVAPAEIAVPRVAGSGRRWPSPRATPSRPSRGMDGTRRAGPPGRPPAPRFAFWPRPRLGPAVAGRWRGDGVRRGDGSGRRGRAGAAVGALAHPGRPCADDGLGPRCAQGRGGVAGASHPPVARPRRRGEPAPVKRRARASGGSARRADRRAVGTEERACRARARRYCSWRTTGGSTLPAGLQSGTGDVASRTPKPTRAARRPSSPAPPSAAASSPRRARAIGTPARSAREGGHAGPAPESRPSRSGGAGWRRRPCPRARPFPPGARPHPCRARASRTPPGPSGASPPRRSIPVPAPRAVGLRWPRIGPRPRGPGDRRAAGGARASIRPVVHRAPTPRRRDRVGPGGA